MAVAGMVLLVVAGGVYAAVVALFYVAQRDILFPAPAGYAPPAAVGLDDTRERPLSTPDGERVMVWHSPAEPGRPTILFFHGNGDTLPSLAGHIRLWRSEGWGVVAATYRGYAGSTGRPSEDALVADGVAVFDDLVADGVCPSQVVVAGYSLGSAVAVAVAARREVGATLLYGALTSVADVAAWHYPFLPVRTFIKDPFDSAGRIGSVSAPVFFVHGERDGVVPVSFGERLMAAVPGPAAMEVVPDTGHVLPPEAGWQAFKRFLGAGLTGLSCPVAEAAR